MTVLCTIEEDDVEHEDSGREVEGMVAKCQRCGHETTAYGTTDGSRRYCLIQMRKQCPKGERNRYVESPRSAD